MFIFYFLGVGPPCCSILRQFWLCKEAQCARLRRHPGSPDKIFSYTEHLQVLNNLILKDILAKIHLLVSLDIVQGKD